MKAGSISPVEKLSVFCLIKKALFAGVGGYVLFLTILFVTKAVSIFIQPEGNIGYEMTDFILPIIGFILLFLIKLLENLKED